MRKQLSLFPNEQPEKCCVAYDSVWKGGDERSRSVRVHCEDLWRDFREFASKHFLLEFPLRFHQRWFEMYLTVLLIRAGHTVECRSHGPDILATINGRSVWIEAVCAENGQLDKADSVPRHAPGVVSQVPIREYVLRFRSSLKEKSDKFKSYISSGFVDVADISIIAINIGAIPFAGAYLDEIAMRSIYGIGDRIVSIDRSSGEIVKSSREEIISVLKASRANVGVQCFIDGSMPHISAIMGSGTNAFNLPERLGNEFIMYPNLTAGKPWSRRLVSLGREWTFEEIDNGWSGTLV